MIRPRVVFYMLALAAVLLIARLAYAAPQLPPEPPDATGPIPDPIVVPADTYRGKTAAQWHRVAERYLHQLRHRWAPTVDYSLRLASAVSGVSYWQLRTVSYCESTHNPFATNGRYKGLFQLGWSPFGFSPFDPVANALSAALTVRHDGSWRQWQCKP